MRWAPYFLGILALSAACVVEDKPVDPMLDGGVDAGLCGGCPADQPICTDELECVQCTADADDYCNDRDLICNTATNECVDCLSSNDCTTPEAAVCNTTTGECEPCTMDAECNDKDGFPQSPNVCDDRVCVDCTPETEAMTCADNKSCNPSTRECTDTDVGSLEVCEACVADSECGANGDPGATYRCVEMFYQGTRHPNENMGFCLKTTEGNCEQPYAISDPFQDRPSLSGPPLDDYCGINEALATCEAVRALELNLRCDGGTKEECPQPSGLCEQVGTLLNRCTYPCNDVTECKDPPAPGSTCDSGPDSVDYCGG